MLLMTPVTVTKAEISPAAKTAAVPEKATEQMVEIPPAETEAKTVAILIPKDRQSLPTLKIKLLLKAKFQTICSDFSLMWKTANMITT